MGLILITHQIRELYRTSLKMEVATTTDNIVVELLITNKIKQNVFFFIQSWPLFGILLMRSFAFIPISPSDEIML